jgi:hypothetical protein
MCVQSTFILVKLIGKFIHRYKKNVAIAITMKLSVTFFKFFCWLQIQGMLKQNEALPDIEKLGRHEFDLDIEEQNRLQAEADAEVNRVSTDKVLTNY